MEIFLKQKILILVISNHDFTFIGISILLHILLVEGYLQLLFCTKVGNFSHSARGQNLFVIEREGRKPDMLEGFFAFILSKKFVS